MPNFQAIKFPESIKINNVTITNLQTVLNTQKKSLAKSSCPKKILAQIFLPPKILRSNISNPQNSFNHPCHLKSGVPHWVRYSSIEGSLEFNPFSRIVRFNSSKKCFFRNLKRVQALPWV